jgi:hypothetical protein
VPAETNAFTDFRDPNVSVEELERRSNLQRFGTAHIAVGSDLFALEREAQLKRQREAGHNA